MRLRFPIRRALLAGLLLLPLRVRAAEPTVQLTEENDVFCGCGLDRHYTQGLRATLQFKRTGTRVRWTLGQTIYTPGDIKRSDLIVHDRPYSGWLWTGPELVSESRSQLWSARFYAGPTGPSSFAEEAQTWVHRTLHAPVPKGWSHQLRTQLGANLFLDSQHRFAIGHGDAAFGADLMPSVTLAAGNVFDNVEARTQLRIGKLDSSPWGDPPIPSYNAAPGSYSGLKGLRPIEVYVVAAVAGRAVGYDYSLQGDHARERFDIKPRPFIGWWEAGLGLAYWRTKAEFRWIVRSSDFEPVTDPQGYGSLRLAVR